MTATLDCWRLTLCAEQLDLALQCLWRVGLIMAVALDKCTTVMFGMSHQL